MTDGRHDAPQFWQDGVRDPTATPRHRLLATWIGRRIRRADGLYRLGGLTFEVPPGRSPALVARLRLGTYEAPERRAIRRFLPADAKVLELGGCLGVVSALINRRLADPAQHVVVEPDAETAAVLRRNRDRNGCAFHVAEGAVTLRRGLRLARRYNPASSTVYRGEQGTLIDAFTVDELAARHGVDFDTIVMDIEGAERYFVREFPGALARCRLVIMEIHAHLGWDGQGEVRAALSAAGLSRRAAIRGTEVWAR